MVGSMFKGNKYTVLASGHDYDELMDKARDIFPSTVANQVFGLVTGNVGRAFVTFCKGANAEHIPVTVYQKKGANEVAVQISCSVGDGKTWVLEQDADTDNVQLYLDVPGGEIGVSSQVLGFVCYVNESGSLACAVGRGQDSPGVFIGKDGEMHTGRVNYADVEKWMLSKF